MLCVLNSTTEIFQLSYQRENRANFEFKMDQKNELANMQYHQNSIFFLLLLLLLFDDNIIQKQLERRKKKRENFLYRCGGRKIYGIPIHPNYSTYIQCIFYVCVRRSTFLFFSSSFCFDIYPQLNIYQPTQNEIKTHTTHQLFFVVVVVVFCFLRIIFLLLLFFRVEGRYRQNIYL